MFKFIFLIITIFFLSEAESNQESPSPVLGDSLNKTITLNDELDQFGNNGPVVVQQTKEEREAKTEKVYLGNVKVVWTNDNNVGVAPKQQTTPPVTAGSATAAPVDDLPF